MFPRSAIAALLLTVLAAPALCVPLDPPSVSAVTADRTSITLQIQAGSSGAPAGFVVEWMPASSYQALGGWPAGASVSGSDFTGVPTLTVTPGVTSFQLGTGEAAVVVLGELFDETGLEATDRTELEDGSAYVVRARAAAAGSNLTESANSATITCVTPTRTPTDCTVSQGYWKVHPESWSRVTALALGTVTYIQSQLLAILNQPARGNGLISLAHQLIATRLNILLGAVPTAPVALAADRADTLIGPSVVPPVGTGWLSPGSTRDLTWILHDFNSGLLDPGHCPTDLHVLPATHPTWGTLKSIYR